MVLSSRPRYRTSNEMRNGNGNARSKRETQTMGTINLQQAISQIQQKQQSL